MGWDWGDNAAPEGWADGLDFSSPMPTQMEDPSASYYMPQGSADNSGMLSPYWGPDISESQASPSAVWDDGAGMLSPYEPPTQYAPQAAQYQVQDTQAPLGFWQNAEQIGSGVENWGRQNPFLTRMLMGGAGAAWGAYGANKQNKIGKKARKDALAAQRNAYAQHMKNTALPSYVRLPTTSPEKIAQAWSGRGGLAQRQAFSGNRVMHAAVGGSIPGEASVMLGPEDIIGLVQGADSGQADTVDARLSPGEYVFDADIVSALGDGNNAAGAGALDQMRQHIRQHKRSAPVNKIPPKAKKPQAYLKKVK